MIKLEIVTPEKKVFDETVDSVTVPTATGEVGILPNHAPLISSLKPGILSFANKGASEKMVVSGGFVEVSTNKVSVLTDIAEKADEIDVEAAKVEREAAQKVMSGAFSGTEEEFEAEKERLERAQARITLATGR
ncbi:MAG TPA: F0F1 ATP synthase subunit epsilon [Pyrinomonadaceae bacterium]|nr:F0F1 ATP synthase subunit epsilon [Pyrinomonadaceae bacterium]